MKRFLLIASAATLLMTSCSEEKFLNISGEEESNKASNGAIEFRAYQPNQSRAKLEEFASSFGIFGVKANLKTDSPNLPDLPTLATHSDKQLIFDNYLVGHKVTYPVIGGGAIETSTPADWYYEGLGYNEYPAVAGASESAWASQYLKYWDASYKFAYFVAYTPYDNTVKDPTKETTAFSPELLRGDDPTTHLFKLNFTTPIEIDTKEPIMVAGKQEKISDHTGTTTSTVSLKFHRVQPQIRIAFYEVIKGYDVQMVNMTYEGKTYGATAMPYEIKEGDYKNGKIILKRNLAVNIANPTENDLSENLKCEFDYTVPTGKDDEYYNYGFLNFDITGLRLGNPKGDKTDFLKEERANKAFSPTVYNVFPQKVSDEEYPANDLQFVLSYKLVAQDTKEVITVYNARVNVPKQYAEWKPNCLYTYVFKITKDAKGTTTSVDLPDPTKPGDPGALALYPIVFDQLTVDDMTDGSTKEFTLYDNDNPTATDDDKKEFIFRSGEDAKDIYAEVGVGNTLDLINDYMTSEYKTLFGTNPRSFSFSSDNAAIATVAAGEVTGVKAGSTTIHVTYKEDGKPDITDAIIVYVTKALQFISKDKVDFKAYEALYLTTLISDPSATPVDKVTWYIYNSTTDTYDPLTGTLSKDAYNYNSNQLTFKIPGKTYWIKVVYKNEDTEMTDFFLAKVAGNSILKYNSTTCEAGIALEINSLVKDTDDVDKVSWKIYHKGSGTWVELNSTDFAGTVYEYTADPLSLKFLDDAKGNSYTLKATYSGTPATTEYIVVNVE